MEFTEGRGGCCIVRSHGDAAQMGRILRQYRPIAPKPPSTGANHVVGPDSVEGGFRAKRGCGGRVRRSKRAKEGPVSTLSLMPETPERTEMTSPTSSTIAVPRPVRAAVVWVTVDRVSEVGERFNGMEGCPGFVSDEGDRVVWVNDELRRMVVEKGEEGAEVRVALVTRGMVPEGRAFTCRVTVRYVCRTRGKVMLAAPCDVWRMEGEGIAWRVDVKAALSLSLVG